MPIDCLWTAYGLPRFIGMPMDCLASTKHLYAASTIHPLYADFGINLPEHAASAAAAGAGVGAGGGGAEAVGSVSGT